MNKRNLKKAMHAAHLGSAVAVGMAISGLDTAPFKNLLIGATVFAALLWSYNKIYGTSWYEPDAPAGDPETPIDNQVRRDLGIE